MDLHVTPYSAPPPVRTFAQMNLERRLLAEISAAGYENPTAIQAQTVPAALAGHDILALAKTGKCAIFLLIIIFEGKKRRRFDASFAVL